jgi:WD40 repeat protein
LPNVTLFQDEVWYADWSHDGVFLATCSKDATCRIYTWSNDNGNLQLKLFCNLAHNGPVNFVTWSPDDTHFVTCTTQDTAIIWQFTEARDAIFHRLQFPNTPFDAVANFFPDGDMIMLGSGLEWERVPLSVLKREMEDQTMDETELDVFNTQPLTDMEEFDDQDEFFTPITVSGFQHGDIITQAPSTAGNSLISLDQQLLTVNEKLVMRQTFHVSRIDDAETVTMKSIRSQSRNPCRLPTLQADGKIFYLTGRLGPYSSPNQVGINLFNYTKQNTLDEVGAVTG